MSYAHTPKFTGSTVSVADYNGIGVNLQAVSRAAGQTERPSWNGFKAWSFPVANWASGVQLLPAGLHLWRLNFDEPLTFTDIGVFVTTAGAGLTNVTASVYSADLATRLATAAGTASAFQSTGLKTITVPQVSIAASSSPQSVVIGFSAEGTTLPTLARGTSSAFANVGLSSGYRYATASGVTVSGGNHPASVTEAAANVAYWVAVK